jgi:hypothetical protein
MERTPEVRGHRLLEVLEAHGLHGPHADGARVVDQDVNGPETLGHVLHHRLDVLAHRDIARDRDHLGPPPLKVLPRAGESGLIPPADRDARAGPRHFAREDQPQPAGSSGDQHRPPAQRVRASAVSPGIEGDERGGHQP